MGLGGERHASAALPPEKRPSTHCKGDWVGAMTGLEEYGKSRPPTEVRTVDRPASSEQLYKLRLAGRRKPGGTYINR
jgi:hypothetical protein